MIKPLAPALLLALLVSILSACTPSDGQKEVVRKERVIVKAEVNGFDPVEIYKKDAPGVVTVVALGAGAAGQGSGFLVSKDGKIATNAHVLIGSDGRSVSKRIYVEYKNRSRKPAQVLLVDRNSDLAILQADYPAGVKPLKLSVRREFSPGEPVAAIGSPFGQSQSLSTGIISATGRSVRSLTNFTIDNALQTDASINPGNSGGPLLDSKSEVIGINQQIQTESGGNDGVGYAIPVSSLSKLLRAVKEGQKQVQYAFLGLVFQDIWPDLAKRLDLPYPAAIVVRVTKDGPADEAGLRGGEREITFQGQPVVVGGDVIVSIDGRKVKKASDISDIIATLAPEDEVEVEFYRKGQKKKVQVVLGVRP